MSYDEPLIGSVAVILAVIATAIGLGPWNEPYRLRSFAALTERYGKLVARGVWVAIALASLTAGFAILGGIRPGYADPAQRASTEP